MVDQGFYNVIVDALNHDTALAKTASLEEKSFHDLDIFECIKEAAIGAALASGAKRLGKGLLYGAGAAAPVAAGGAFLVDHAAKAKEEATKNVIEDVRNKALQTAAAVGGVGAGLLGMHHMLQKQRAASAPQQQTPDAVPTSSWQGLAPSSYSYKMSAENKGFSSGAVNPNAPLPPAPPFKYQEHQTMDIKPTQQQKLKPMTIEASFTPVEQDLLQKFSTVGFLDCVLEPLEKEANAKEMRLLNAEYGVDILKTLLG